MNLKRIFGLLNNVRAHRHWIRDTKEPEAAQSRAWQRIRSRIDQGSFWQKHYEGQKKPVPRNLQEFAITTFEDYRSAIDAAFSEQHSPLTGEEILFWAESSGTTGKRKLFPLTASYRAELQTTLHPLVYQIARRLPGFMSQPVLYFAGTWPAERSEKGIDVGMISHFNYRSVSPFLQKFYAFPLSVFRDHATFLEYGPLYGMASDLSGMFAITPSVLLQFYRQILKEGTRYLEILEGKQALPEGLPLPVVSKERLGLLKKLFGSPERTEFHFKELWPSLQFVCFWIHSTAGMQLPLLAAPLKGIPLIDATYSATEGWMTIALIEKDGSGRDGVFNPTGHIVEFLELKTSVILKPWELQVGQDYEILLTTSMGLIRYRLFDIVRCTGFFNRSPKLEFRQKAGNILSLAQAKIPESHLLEAFAKVGLKIPEKCLIGPSLHADRLCIYVAEIPSEWSEKLIELEETLQKINPEYWNDRISGFLEPLTVLAIGNSHPAWPISGSIKAQTKPSLLTTLALQPLAVSTQS